MITPTTKQIPPLIKLLNILACLSISTQAGESYSDPLSPQAAHKVSQPKEISMFQIGNRLEQIEQLIKQEKHALQTLAPLQPAKQFDTFGYHSDYLPHLTKVPEQPRWAITLKAGANPTEALVLVPAIDQRSSELKGYAFPKRFRIYSIDNKGKHLKMLVDWTSQDFPNPGLRPVYFSFPKEEAPTERIRLEVHAGHEENGLEFFALGRLHPIRQGEQQHTVLYGTSSSYESTPYWSKQYLASARQTLGMPLSSSQENGKNVIMNLPATRLKKPLVIHLELDKAEPLGWVNIFPGQSPDGLDVPGYGLPKEIRFFSIKKRPDGSISKRIRLNSISRLGQLGNNMFRIGAGDRVIDALEIECNDFPKYQEKAVFSLGEIELIKGKRNLSYGRKVTASGLQPNENTDLSLLVDGKVSGQDILSLPEWFQQLAAGKNHEAKLAMLEAEHSHLSERSQHIRQLATIWIAILVTLIILTLIYLIIRSKKLAEKRLSQQIYSDLHDEVGSNLGSISLMAGQLEGVAQSDRMKAGMFDLALMTREACTSLREVVWLVDQKTIRLPALIRKLTERAERVLNAADVTVEIPDNCPDEIVSMPIKRHMIMFFKELIHNCARHAHATHVKIIITIKQKNLEISVTDNGTGFDTAQKSDGWGLGSMKQRAQEMGGKMKLHSTPATGTTITLTVPMSQLSKQPSNTYKTSN